MFFFDKGSNNLENTDTISAFLNRRSASADITVSAQRYIFSSTANYENGMIL